MRFIFSILISVMFIGVVTGQTRKELEDQRKKTLEEIGYVDNLLKETTREKSTGLDQLKIIGNKLNLRENVITGMREEINLLNERIDLNTIAIEMMDKDLLLMKRDYAKTIINTYKAGKGNPEIGYILSAKDFNQGYKRIKYLQQVTRFRHQETEIIVELQIQIENSKEKLQEDLSNISDLKSKEERQKSMLQQEQDKKKRIVQTFSNKERQLKKDLEEKKRIAQKIEADLARIFEEERKKRISTDLTPEQKLIGDNFADNKGRLPWPVEKGIITSQFGEHQHPVLVNVTEKNIGIEITSSGKTIARSVFKGEVMRVFPISGENIAIIIRHGKFRSVYLNLKVVWVKQGDNVDLKQPIGEVFSDPDNGSKAVLKFMIFDEKYLDPESWISKRSGTL
jgi:septal ring factor EnvC (AmiA/AmiB activator)